MSIEKSRNISPLTHANCGIFDEQRRPTHRFKAQLEFNGSRPPQIGKHLRPL